MPRVAGNWSEFFFVHYSGRRSHFSAGGMQIVLNQVFKYFSRAGVSYFYPLHFPTQGRVTFPNRMNFRKSSERGGGHFQSKNLYCKIWTFKQLFDHGFVASLKNLQCNFPKMRGRGGSKAVWNFSENSSILDVRGIPQQTVDRNLHNAASIG